MSGLIRGELGLTIDIIFGLILGGIIIRLKIPDLLMKKIMPFLERNNIPAVTGLALSVSAGSSKAGAAIISSALENNTISERSAVWSVLMLPFPSYLRRWPATLTLSISMAGRAGLIFALSLILRSAVRFVIALMFLRSEDNNSSSHHEFQEVPIKPLNLTKKLIHTLPLAWLFFALAYSIVPVIDNSLRSLFTETNILSFLPLSGWTVAAASVAHMSSSLALAGGAISSGELNTSEAVFALILGSGLGTAARILRQNAGYYFGLFPVKTARKMLILNFMTIMPLIILNLIFAGLALLF